MGVLASVAGPAVIKSNRCTHSVCVGWIPEERKKGKGRKKERKRVRESGLRLADKVAAAHIM